MKITQSVRIIARQYIAETADYDDATMTIQRDGWVTAKKSADKTYRSDNRRYLVRHIGDIMADVREKAAAMIAAGHKA